MPRFLTIAWLALGCAPEATEPVGQAERTGVARSVPIYGGTAAADDSLIVGAFPGHDYLVFVKRQRGEPARFMGQLELPLGSEPFRVLVTPERVLVTLRGAESVLSVDRATLEVEQRIWVCPEPRGLARSSDDVLVACASGELVTLSPDLEIRQRWLVEPDLRDVAVTERGTFISRFRTAQVLRVDREQQAVLGRATPVLNKTRQARTAWRMRADEDGSVVLLHEAVALITLGEELLDEAEEVEKEPPPPVYYGPPPHQDDDPVPCPQERLITTHITRMTPGETISVSGPLGFVVQGVDFTILRDTVVVADAAANASRVREFALDRLSDGTACVPSVPMQHDGPIATSVEATDGGLVSLSAGRPSLTYGPQEVFADFSVDFDQVSLTPLAHFTLASPAGIACASCHPEGQDDGHVWQFGALGPRRTQNLAGRLLERAPYHWEGELDSMVELIDDVFETRMRGPRLGAHASEALGEWLHDLPVVRTTPEGPAEDIGRGRELFRESGCLACHNGPAFTDGQLHQVRREQTPKKTPSLLGVGSRAPYMHDGCAPTLHDRFLDEACGGGDLHGHTSTLSGREVDALVWYLQTL